MHRFCKISPTCRQLCRCCCLFLVGFVLCFSLSGLPTRQSAVVAQPNPAEQLMDDGIEQYHKGQFNEAITLWQQALSQTTLAKERAVLHNNLALAYRQIGKLAEAIAQWEQAIQIYQNQKDHQGPLSLSNLLTEQAQAYTELGQHRRAITRLQSAVELASQNPDSRAQAAAMGALGNAYWALGEYEQALETHQKSLQIARQLNYPDYITASLNNLGNVHISRLQRYRYQANIASVEGDGKENARLTQLEKQEIAAARLAFEGSLHQSQNLDSIAKVKALLNLNRLLEQLSPPDWVTIAKNRQQALTRVETLSNSRDKAYVLINLAESFRRQASAEIQPSQGGVQLLEKALTITRNIGDRRAESFVLGSLSQLYHSAGQASTAMELTRQAQLAAQQVNAADSLYRWQWQAGRLLKSAGKTKDAMTAYEQAIVTLQSIRSNLLAADTDLQFDFRDSVEPVYRELIQLLLDGDQEQTNVVETQFIVSGIKESKKTLNAQEVAKVSRTNLEKVLDTLDLLKLAELQNFFGDECVQVAQADAKSSASLLDPGAAVIYSVILNDHSEIILRLPNDQLRSHRLSRTQAQMQQDIDQLRRFLEKRSTNEYLIPAQQIYNTLIRPLEADLATADIKTLVFVQDGVLRQVPMGALHDGQQFLIQKYAIATTPSLSLTTPTSVTSSNSGALIMGLTVERPPFEALTNVRAEVSSVHKILGGTELLDQEFTLAALQEQLQTHSYPIVHLATHGKFSADSASTFLLAFDTRITLEQIDHILRTSPRPQALELLTLSACQSAAGDNRAALGIAGVAVRAGARSALASLWYINDEATVPLIDEFYTQLRQPNRTKAEALRKAQLKMITTLEYNHPAVWSSFILIGNWQ